MDVNPDLWANWTIISEPAFRSKVAELVCRRILESGEFESPNRNSLPYPREIGIIIGKFMLDDSYSWECEMRTVEFGGGAAI